jgi:hypothetical protein
MHHAGGRQHVAWFTVPLCRRHHERFHILCVQADIDLRWTDDPIERVRRALGAIKILEWMLLEQMKHQPQSTGETKP